MSETAEPESAIDSVVVAAPDARMRFVGPSVGEATVETTLPLASILYSAAVSRACPLRLTGSSTVAVTVHVPAGKAMAPVPSTIQPAHDEADADPATAELPNPAATPGAKAA